MKHPVDPNYDPKPGGKKNPYPSGNEGRLHPGLKHPGYFSRWTRDEDGNRVPRKKS